MPFGVRSLKQPGMYGMCFTRTVLRSMLQQACHLWPAAWNDLVGACHGQDCAGAQEERTAAKAARKAKKRAKRDKREREAASPPSPSAGSPDNAAPEGAETRKRGRSEELQLRHDGRRAARHDSAIPDAGGERMHQGAHEHSRDASVARHAAHRQRHDSPGALRGGGRAHEASHEHRRGASPPRHAALRQRHDSLSPDAMHGRADRHTARRSRDRGERGREGAGRRRHDTPSPPRRRGGRGSASPV